MTMPNLAAYAMDGRRFLAHPPAGAEAPYDVVAVDAYRPPYIPFHLITAEFFALARDRLAAVRGGCGQRRPHAHGL